MTTRHSTTSLSALRSTAEAKVATWRELAADAQAKQAALTEYAAANPLPSGMYVGNRRMLRATPLMLDHATRSLAATEARERAAIAEHEAALALDAEELAGGDNVARGRDLPTLRSELVESFAAVAAAEAALRAVQRRAHERVQATKQAELVVSARRRAADLPYLGSSFSVDPGRSLLANVDDAIARGVPMPGSGGSANLRAEIRSLATELEEERLEKEAAEKEAARVQANKEDEIRRRQTDEHQATAARQRTADEDRQKREALADAYLNRRAGGAGQ
jgi:hypothetical protein